jgi:hypothetical protein
MKDKNLDLDQAKAQLNLLKSLITIKDNDNFIEAIKGEHEKIIIERKYRKHANSVLILFILSILGVALLYYSLTKGFPLFERFSSNSKGIELAYIFITCMTVLLISALTAGVLYYTNRSFYKELSEVTSSGFRSVEKIITRNIQSYATIYIGHLDVIECLNEIFEKSINAESENEREITYFGAPGFTRFEDEEGKIELLSLEPWTEKKLKDEIQILKKKEDDTKEKMAKNEVIRERHELELKLNRLKKFTSLIEVYSVNQRNEKLKVTRYINLDVRKELNSRSPLVQKKYLEWLAKQTDRIGNKYVLIEAKRAPSWFDSMSYFITHDQITLVVGEGDLALSINGEYFSRTFIKGLIEYLEAALLQENLPHKISKEKVLEMVNDLNN